MPEKKAEFFDKRAPDYEMHMHQNLEEFDKFYHSVRELIETSNQKLSILVKN